MINTLLTHNMKLLHERNDLPEGTEERMQEKSVEYQFEQMNTDTKGRLVPIGIKFIFAVLIMAVGAFLLMYVIKEKGYYLSGYDTWGHFFKSNIMYHGIMEGDYYPLYTNLWYNGMQPYRY